MKTKSDYPMRDPADKIDCDPIMPQKDIGVVVDVGKVWKWLKKILKVKK